MFVRLLFLLLLPAVALSQTTLNPKASGYNGIWYFIGKTGNAYAHKYSGGLGTYPANHYPFSVYAPAVRKTFFCYGGVLDSTTQKLCHFVGFYDHRTGQVSRPTLLLDKQTDDAHDNPIIQLDDRGYIWIFSTSHGTERPSFIHRSRQPYGIDAFDPVAATRLDEAGRPVPFDNFSYVQSYYQPGRGFLNLMTHYDRGVLVYGANKPRRTMSFITSPDGQTWSAWQDLGTIEEGHYQTSGQWRNKIGTAFNYHPNTQKGSGLDYRTNLYYLETGDFGKTWKTAGGQTVALPLRDPAHPALVKEYKSEGKNVYINDVAYDGQGRPILFYLTSKGPEPGPENGPYQWNTAWWNGRQWEIREVAQSDHNYDMGSLYVEGGLWRIIGPLEPGGQPFGTGGGLAMLESRDQGRTWQKVKSLTPGSERNHSYPRRPVGAHPDFVALWADGNARQVSPSRLYFCNQQGQVFQLPTVMKADLEKPVPVFTTPVRKTPNEPK
ncbi:BNR-4 repeat-containing protein [Tellurirhabdus rosea]|uniref:BNR-4 repeat-containing protein n=1 Tax=Tellurirhabdus rosea TaxID=2674997 RepID=UPI002252EE06|nr:BNR-4 repeat-containing protein [Tellurirhabdus rosea]